MKLAAHRIMFSRDALGAPGRDRTILFLFYVFLLFKLPLLLLLLLLLVLLLLLLLLLGAQRSRRSDEWLRRGVY